MSPSSLINEIARANSRAFGAMDGDMPSAHGCACEANSSNLPVREETLNLSFFFDMWKREFCFEGSIGDRFVFTDELRMAFSINPRDFWEVLLRTDRELGTYLKDACELMGMPTSAVHDFVGTSASVLRDLPHEISINRRMNGGSVDVATVRSLWDKLPHMRENFSSQDIVKVGLEVLGLDAPSDYELRNLVEKLERKNSLRRVGSEKFTVIPKKILDRISTDCLLEYFKNMPLDSAELAAMDKGIYTVTQADLSLVARQGNDAFWQSILPDRNIRDRTLNMRKLLGFLSNADSLHVGSNILVATDRSLSDALYKHQDEMREIYSSLQASGSLQSRGG